MSISIPVALLFANPLLAAGESIIGLIVVALTIASWIVNVVSQYSQSKPQPVVRPKGNRPSEPDRRSDRDFGRGLGNEDRSRQQQQQKKRSQGDGRPRQKNPPQQRKPAPPPVPSDQEQSRKPLGGTISERHLETSSLGKGVRESVREHMQEHSLAKTVAKDMQSSVGTAVQDHLGAFSTGAAPGAIGTNSGKDIQQDSLLTLFRNPQTMRQIMVANIVLSKPAALTKRGQ